MQVLLLLLVFGLVLAQERLDLLVETSQGLIRGLNAEDGDYSMFLGIPFGKFDNPFATSYPHPEFDDIFDAFYDSPICPQVDEFSHEIVGTTDCLHLNVYVPNKANSTNRLPVLVWIYGGGFQIGYANRYLYGPKYLVRHDVILVTLNYRIGPYGFFCLGTPDIPGNQGIKDQLLALRWIKKNIASFGGDDNKITIMGESAGATSVEQHLYFDNVENLYSQVILQSGTLFIPGFVKKTDTTHPLRIAERLGFVTEDFSEAIDFLANTDSNLVIAASIEVGYGYSPCIEQEFEGVESLLTDHPLNLDIPWVRSIPVLAGFNNRESMAGFVNQPEDFYKNLNTINDMLEYIFDYDEDFLIMEDRVRHFYLGDEEESEETRFKLSDFQSDIFFNYPVQKSLNKFVKNGATQVYQYMFSYSGGRNFVKKRFNITDEGAVHADEIAYLFDLSYDKDPISEDDQRIIDQITTLWTNFVKYGEPTPETTELLPEKWIPITADTINYLNIDTELKMEKRPYHGRLTFWELFYLANKGRLKDLQYG